MRVLGLGLGDKVQIKAGQSAEEICANPNSAVQVDIDARWTLKHSKRKRDAELDLAISYLG